MLGLPTERKGAEPAPRVKGVHRTWGRLCGGRELCTTPAGQDPRPCPCPRRATLAGRPMSRLRPLSALWMVRRVWLARAKSQQTLGALCVLLR